MATVTTERGLTRDTFCNCKKQMLRDICIALDQKTNKPGFAVTIFFHIAKDEKNEEHCAATIGADGF